MKLLFVSTSGVGHVQPMLGLALAARQRGHAIAWATAPDAWPLLHAHDITTLAAGVTFAQCRNETRQRWPHAPRGGRAQAAHAFPHQFGTVIFAHMLRPLAVAMDAWQPNLVINESGALAAPLVATQRGVPHITHAFGLPIPADILASTTAAVAPAWHAAGLDVPTCAGLYAHGGIEIAPATLLAAHGHAPQAARSLHQQAASITGSGKDRLPESLIRLMQADDKRPLVYATFGTLFDQGPAFAQLLRGLANLPARVIVTSPCLPQMPEAATPPPNTLLCGYVPQHLILPHCQAVVSHAGSGTMFGAIAHGLPQLCLPQGADQFRNADALVATGAALMLEGEQVNSAAIHTAMQELLHQPAVRACAQALAAETAAQSTPDEVAMVLQSFA
jgi:hypothetical protein